LLSANAWGELLPANAAANAASQCLFESYGEWPFAFGTKRLFALECNGALLPANAYSLQLLANGKAAKRPIALPSWATRRRHPAHSPAGELLGGGAVAVSKRSRVRADTQRPLPLPRAPPVGL
jgi:hypothetical protein